MDLLLKKPSSKNAFLKHINPNNSIKENFKRAIKNPFGQFVILGVVLIVINFLAVVGLLPKSLTIALATVIIYAIISIGFCMLIGYSGLASLGTAGFAGIGAYTGFYILQELRASYFTALIVSILISIAIGLIVGFISLRIEGMYLAILTLGLAEILFAIFLNLKQMPQIGARQITFFFIRLDDSGKFILITVMFVLLLWLTNNLINSPTGRAMLAMKNSTSAAQAMGISLMKYRLLAFIISTVYAAIGGLLYIMLTKAISTSSSMFLSLTMSLNILGCVVLGGAKSLWGTSIGVLLIYGLQTIFLNNIPFFADNPEIMSFISGILIILVVMFFPGGLYQIFYEVKFKIIKLKKKWRMKKYGIN